MSICGRMKRDPYLFPCTKLKFKWINGLNVNSATLNLVEENMGSSLECMDTGDHFLNITTVAQTLRLTVNK